MYYLSGSEGRKGCGLAGAMPVLGVQSGCRPGLQSHMKGQLGEMRCMSLLTYMVFGSLSSPKESIPMGASGHGHWLPGLNDASESA